MNKKFIIKKNSEYNRLIQNYKPIRYKYISLYIENTKSDKTLFGFSVGKKIGGAVVRNKIKRQLKAIIQKKTYQKGINCIIMVNSGILNKSFQEIQKDLLNVLIKQGVIKGESNE